MPYPPPPGSQSQHSCLGLFQARCSLPLVCKVSVLLSSGSPLTRTVYPAHVEPRGQEMGALRNGRSLLGHLLSFMVFGEKKCKVCMGSMRGFQREVVSFAIAYNAPLSGFPFLVSFSSLTILPGITSKYFVLKAMFQALLSVGSEDTGHRPLSQISANIGACRTWRMYYSLTGVLCYVHWGKKKHHLKIDNCVLFCRRGWGLKPRT